MGEESTKLRWLNIGLASLALALLCLFADQKGPEIYSTVYLHGAGDITSNGSLVLAVSNKSFTVRWQNGKPKTFKIATAPSFQVGDRITFKLKRSNGHYLLEEHHVWASQTQWFWTLVLSFPPLLIVLFLFFRDYKFSFSHVMFSQRKD